MTFIPLTIVSGQILYIPMQSTVNKLIYKLTHNQFPDNQGGHDASKSWGIAFTLSPDTNESIFDIHPRLKTAVVESKLALAYLDEETPSPQFILDYKRESWLLAFEFYDNDCRRCNRFSMIVELETGEVVSFLTKALASGVKLYDVLGSEVLNNL